MIKKSIFLAVVIVLFFSAYGLCADKYNDARNHIASWNGIMEESINKLKKLDDLSSVSKICEDLAKKVDSITPALKKLWNKYPELSSENPPDEMKNLMDENKSLSMRFNNKLTELMKLANKHSDNQAFQNAFGKLNMAVYKMRR